MVIRRTRKEDIPSMLALVKELAEYERAPEEVIVDETLFAQYWEEQVFEALVAVKGDQVIGTAIFYTAYSTWKGKIVYLDDIIVTMNHRRSGAGTALFDSVIRHCKDIGAKQLRWHVLDWNEPAINFYKKYDAELDADWVVGRMNFER